MAHVELPFPQRFWKGCKPNFVYPAKRRGENHLSQQPVPGTRSAVRNRNGPFQGPLFGLAPDGVFRASALTLGAVGSYPAFSPLPPNQRLGVDGGLFSVAPSVGTPYGVTPRVYPAL